MKQVPSVVQSVAAGSLLALLLHNNKGSQGRCSVCTTPAHTHSLTHEGSGKAAMLLPSLPINWGNFGRERGEGLASNGEAQWQVSLKAERIRTKNTGPIMGGQSRPFLCAQQIRPLFAENSPTYLPSSLYFASPSRSSDRRRQQDLLP